jgi:hypothetical protein
MKNTMFSWVKSMPMVSNIGLAFVAVLFLASCSSTGSQTVYTPGSSSGVTVEPELSPAQQEEARLQAAQERRLAQAREAERLAEAAEREAQRQHELAAQRAAEQARIVAAQQARIEELRARIAANESETENLESANAVLRQAVAAAELLTEALMNEEEKYNNTDPVSGEPLEPLATARLEALAQELESLGNQAESLMSQP